MSTYYFHCCFIMIILENDIVVSVSADLKESLAFEKLHSHCTHIAHLTKWNKYSAFTDGIKHSDTSI